MQVTPYLTFPGTCAEAMAFYAETLGGTLLPMMTYGEGPPELAEMTAPEHHHYIMHARIDLGDGGLLMASDNTPDRYNTPAGTEISIAPRDDAEAKRIFDALAEGGHIKMPLQPTFWASSFGMLTDRYGTPWMVNVETPMA